MVSGWMGRETEMNEWFLKNRKVVIGCGLAVLFLIFLAIGLWDKESSSPAGDAPVKNEVRKDAPNEQINSFAAGESDPADQSDPEVFFAQFPFAASYEEHKEWIIKWKEGYDQPQADRFEILEVDDKRKLMLVRLNDGVEAKTWYQIWAVRSDIEFIRPNQRIEIKNQDGTDALGKMPDYLEQINAPEGWKVVEGNDDVIIAVLDTGIDLNHPLLKPYLVEGAYLIYDYDEKNNERKRASRLPHDDNGHGTRVAGVIVAAENKWGYRGLLKSAKLMPVKVIKADGEGTEFDVAQGIYYAVDHGADIVLLSAGFPFNSENMRDAVLYAHEHDVLVIAASGNSEAQDISSQINYPAAYPSVIAVGAVNEKDEHERYSNYGPELDVVAPGRVYTTDVGGGFTVDEGTSFAAPQVAGLAALIMEKFPNLTPLEVRHHIRYTAQDVGPEGWDEMTGYGRIDVGKALTEPPVKDLYAENETLEDAAPLPIETIVSAEIRNNEDQDVYYVDAPYPGTIQLHIRLHVGKYEGVDLIFYPNGRPDEAQTFTIQKEKVLKISVPAGKSFVRIAYNKNERRTTPLPYDMVHTFHIYQDLQHPNQDRSSAYPLQNGQVIVGTFHEAGQKDWFYFDVPEAGTIQVNVSVYTNRCDPVLELYTPQGERLERDLNEPPWEEEQVLDVDPGRYYIVVSDWYANQVNEEYYLAVIYTREDEQNPS
jgi:subtilisin family serine protease